MNAGIVKVSQKMLLNLLGLEGGRIVGIRMDEDWNHIEVIAEHPSMPEAPEGEPVPAVTVWETVETCEHGGVTKRETRLVA